MILVTGAAGMIGANCIEALNASGRNDIIACDTFHDQDERWQNLVRADVYDIVLADELAAYLQSHGGRQISSVLHLGAISSTTEKNIEKLIRLNIQATNTLWHHCCEQNVPFIYASSAATYGDGTAGFDDDPTLIHRLKPLNAYGWSKHMSDRQHLQFAQRKMAPPQWVGLKFFNVFGPFEAHKADMRSVVTKFYPQIKAGDTVRLFKSDHPDFEDGGQSRDFVYVRDCVRVIQWFMDNNDVSGIFNCGTGKARSFLDLALAVYRSTGKKPDIDYFEMPAQLQGKYQYFTEARLDRLRRAGCDIHFLSLEDAVDDYVTAWLEPGRCPV